MHPGIRGVAAILGVAVLVAGCSSPSEPAAQSREQSPAPSTAVEPAAATPLLAEVIAPPIPAPATDGKVHLAYELQLTNALGQDVTVTSVAVKAGDKPLLTLTGDRLSYWMRTLGGQEPTTKLGPGQSSVVWLDVVIDGPTDSTPAVPQELSHTIVTNLTKPIPPLLPPTMTEDVAPVTVSTHEPPVISPPLDGPRWVDANSCCDMTAHRMALNPLNGKLWAAERFAIDYLQMSPDGTIFRGDASKPESYPYFGADIHAVADGPVVSVVDGLPEQVAGQSPTGLPLDQYGGNHIVQDIGDGNYAFYAHLKTGTVKVKPGDRLSTGQVIANLGNSGNTDAPHLHFHVMSTPDPLMANGIPFIFKSFKLDGRLASMNGVDDLVAGKPAPVQPGFTARDEENVSPLVLDVMTYAAG
ncbi:M23 family peptidase [Mycolicibacterium sp. P9-64]|uniref:M23 family metallopeptidase n=1 Tax=Mycolicibacterium sp. P9-64 TaxID=2024612 RepID=UPI0011EBE7AA|nr:M23 family metallopeptidase [Mycolicibacterium sp. P9-64]KAA0086401.1 M23 family peptidase [Mycolicibacterium sp. P9-64]